MLAFADQPTARFASVDWLVVAVYLGLLIGIAVWSARRAAQRDGASEFFLAGRSMPIWAVSLSLLATMLSAATFIGGPEFSYARDLSYLIQEVGGIIAIVIVAMVFLPRFYSLGVTSVYELLGASFGAGARRSASAMFLVGRVFASGARLFMVAIPFSLIAFAESSHSSLISSIIIITIVAALYTMVGGIRAVIWTDALQAGILLIALVGAIAVVVDRIGLPVNEIYAAIRDASTRPDTPDKMRLLDFSLDPTKTFTIWTALTGWLLFHLAALGTDQDLAQRLLTCRDARRGATSAIVGKLLSVPMTAMFLLLGLLLFVLYRMPEVVVAAAPEAPESSRDVFLQFILTEMPAGLRGLMIAGLFAAAMSSLDSALSAMASAVVTDFLPERAFSRRRSLVMRLAVALCAVALGGFACLCVGLHARSGQTLITFALGVMMYAYSGLLAVFLTALLTKRGNSASALGALGTGFVYIAIMDPSSWKLVESSGMRAAGEPLPWFAQLAMPWRMTIATIAAFCVCAAGRRKSVT